MVCFDLAIQMTRLNTARCLLPEIDVGGERRLLDGTMPIAALTQLVGIPHNQSTVWLWFIHKIVLLYIPKSWIIRWETWAIHLGGSLFHSVLPFPNDPLYTEMLSNTTGPGSFTRAHHLPLMILALKVLVRVHGILISNLSFKGPGSFTRDPHL